MLAKPKPVIITFLLIAALLMSAYCQRGGSRSRSRSSSSRSSSSSSKSSWGSSSRTHHHHHYGSGSVGKKENCTTVNGTTTCTTTEKELTAEQTFVVIFFVLVIFGLAAIFGNKKDDQRFKVTSNSSPSEKRKKIVQDAMNNFEMRMEAWPSTLSPEVRNSMLDAFMSRKYTMIANVRDQDEKFYCPVKVVDLKKEGQCKYHIKMTGSDQVGTSKIEGILLFTGPGMGFKLSKVYDNRSAAEQTGRFSELFYEGGGNPDGFNGTWAFNGFENSMEYSGQWVMNTF